MIQLNDKLQKSAVSSFGQKPFSKKEQMLARYARALAHPARIVILRYIAKNDNCICGDIVDILPLAQSTTSQHLQKLVKAGIIKHTNRGSQSCFAINFDVVESVNQLFTDFLSGLIAIRQLSTIKMTRRTRRYNKSTIK